MNKGDENPLAIKERSDAIRKSSVLSLIKEKEFEIKAEIVKTRQKAAEIVESARSKAQEIIESAKEKALQDGDELYRQEVEKARKRAEKIIKDAEKKSKKLESEFNVLLEEASSFVSSLILGESEI